MEVEIEICAEKCTLKAVFRIRIRPDPKLFGLKDLNSKLLISDPDPDPSLSHTKLRNMFQKCTKK